MLLRDPHERIHVHHVGESWRTDAQVDADRIWYSPEFRRLEGVTQVVPPQDEYVFHDRLTHSVKVAQVAATLARRQLDLASRDTEPLHKSLQASSVDITEWIDPDFCYAAGLAHDIGHPPFGHAGEVALQEMARRQSPLLQNRSFEGNAQSTRIVASLSFRKPPVNGLDLTLRSLAAIAKYPWKRGQHPANVPKLAGKWSFYEEEAHVLDALILRGFVVEDRVTEDEAAADGGTAGTVTAVYRWPEAEIMDWADDISYAVHDLEDFYRAGRIPLHRIASAFANIPKPFTGLPTDSARNLWRNTEFFEMAQNDEEVRRALVYARSKMMKTLDEEGNSLAAYVPDAFMQIHSVLQEKMPTNRFDGTQNAHTDLQRFASDAITYLSVNADAVVIDVKGAKRVAFRVRPAARVAAEFFKAICHYYVIESSALATMQYGQARTLNRLAEALVSITIPWLERGEDVSQQQSLPARLREYLKDRAALSGKFREELKEITDKLERKPTDFMDHGALVERRDAILADERSEILTCVFDYMCSLRDVQASILEERLFGNRTSLTLSTSWLDA